MYGYNAMEVQEAFVKIREQVRQGGVCVCVGGGGEGVWGVGQRAVGRAACMRR